MKIITYPNEILRKHTVDIEVFDQSLIDLVEEMKVAMTTENGIGLAAPQVGSNLSLFIMRLENGKIKTYANPEIKWCSSTMSLYREGCLSFPDVMIKVSRYDQVEGTAKDEFGKTFVFAHKGIMSQCVQHEIEHLNGVLLVDKMNRGDRRKFKVYK